MFDRLLRREFHYLPGKLEVFQLRYGRRRRGLHLVDSPDQLKRRDPDLLLRK